MTIQFNENTGLTILLATLAFILTVILLFKLFKPVSITITILKIFTIVFKRAKQTPSTIVPVSPKPIQTVPPSLDFNDIDLLRFLLFYAAIYSVSERENFLDDLTDAYCWASTLNLADEVYIALEAVIYFVILHSYVFPWTLGSAQMFSRIVLHICTLIN